MGSQFASEPQALLSIFFLNVAFMIRKGAVDLRTWSLRTICTGLFLLKKEDRERKDKWIGILCIVDTLFCIHGLR